MKYMATSIIAKESKRTNYDISYNTGYQKLSNTKSWFYVRDNEVHLHVEVYANTTFKAGTYAYPLKQIPALAPSAPIMDICAFYVAGGAAGTARGVFGYVSISSTGNIVVMPLASHTSDSLNCCIIDVVYPLD